MVEVRLIDGQLKMQRFYRDDVPIADAKGNLAAFFTLLHRQVLDLRSGSTNPKGSNRWLSNSPLKHCQPQTEPDLQSR